MPNKPSPSARKKARRFALQGLYQWQITGTPVQDIEHQFRIENDMKKVDMAYFKDLLKQSTKQIEELENNFETHLDRKVTELDPVTKAILLISTYELKDRIEIPYKVVINEAVELAKDFGAEDSHRYVNGILDKLSRELRQVETNA